MKKIVLRIIPVLLVFVFIQSCEEPLVVDELSKDTLLKSAAIEKKSYIVVLKDAELDAELLKLKGYEKKQLAVKTKSQKLLKKAGISGGEIGLVYGTALRGFSVKIPPGQLKKLENDPSVVSVTEDKFIKLDKPDFRIEGDALPGETIPYGIARVNGGFNYSGTNVVWIIDTGIDDHPDLNVDFSRGASYVDGNTSPVDDEGHGTHVAGTVAAKNDGDGVIGVAAGATVIPVKVLDSDGSGWYSWIIAGVDYVAAKGAPGDVANMSLGGPKDNSLNQAVTEAAKLGILFALAAGNERTDAGTRSPASAEHENIYTVSGCDINDRWYRYSNYGNPPVDYCAPGVSVYSTYPGNRYATMTGTSMAAPHVAGILLLGNLQSDGFVTRDKDRNNDPIAVYGGGSGEEPPPQNQAPVADAGGNQTKTDAEANGESVTLDGSGSYDPDGDALTYSWMFNGNEIGQQATITHTFPIGPHTVTLNVSDGKLTGSDEVTITINGVNQDAAPVIDNFVVTPTSNPARKRVSVNWSVSDADGDLATVTTTLTGPNDETASVTSNVSGGDVSGIHEPSIRRGSTGTYTITTTVTDSNGNEDSDTTTKEL